MGFFDFLKTEKKAPDKFLDKDWQTVSKRYYDGLQKIESQWSVLYNLKCFSGPKAEKFISLCEENIQVFFTMKQIEKRYDSEDFPPSVPAFKRLAMIYEKQKNFDAAIKVCIDAIKCSATVDGSKGGMQGRLARLIKKAGITPTAEMEKFMLK